MMKGAFMTRRVLLGLAALLCFPMLAFGPLPPVEPTTALQADPYGVVDFVLRSPAATEVNGEDQRRPGSAGDAQYVTTYALPVRPLNLVMDSAGDIWFSSFNADGSNDPNGALGKLEVGAANVLTYRLPGQGNVWGVSQNGQGDIWYTTVRPTDNGPPAYIGCLQPATGTLTRWPVAFQNFGVKVDRITGDVWFGSAADLDPVDDAPGIYRLDPMTNAVTRWDPTPFDSVIDVGRDADGMVWFTLQNPAHAGIGKLDPATNRVTVWQVPTPTSAPFRILVAGPDEIWFSQLNPDGNSLARLIPSTGLLQEYPLSEAASWPSGLAGGDGSIWFTAARGDYVGRLAVAQGLPTETSLSPTTVDAQVSTAPVTPEVSVLSPQVVSSQTGRVLALSQSSQGFTYFSPWSGFASPFAVALDVDQQEVWFTEGDGKRISRLDIQAQPTEPIYLPIMLRVR
jgi:streptogramin lyase